MALLQVAMPHSAALLSVLAHVLLLLLLVLVLVLLPAAFLSFSFHKDAAVGAVPPCVVGFPGYVVAGPVLLRHQVFPHCSGKRTFLLLLLLALLARLATAVAIAALAMATATTTATAPPRVRAEAGVPHAFCLRPPRLVAPGGGLEDVVGPALPLVLLAAAALLVLLGPVQARRELRLRQPDRHARRREPGSTTTTAAAAAAATATIAAACCPCSRSRSCCCASSSWRGRRGCRYGWCNLRDLSGTPAAATPTRPRLLALLALLALRRRRHQCRAGVGGRRCFCFCCCCCCC